MPTDRFDIEPPGEPREPWSQEFWWSFGVCAGAPPLAAMVGWFWPALGGGDPYGAVFVPVFTTPLWIIALVTGLAMAARPPRKTGWEVLLGTLLGAAVGFSACSGVFVAFDGLGL